MNKNLTPAQIKEFQAKREHADLLQKQISLREGLPFLYGWKWYAWARDFFDSTNRINLLVAANQISKSSTQIRKCIDWATNDKKWPALWSRKPNMFWYLYPSMGVATVEFEKKWSLFLPRGEYKDHPVYGWRSVYKNKEISAIHFNSGVSVYFKSYTQDVMNLQTGTVDAIFADEELPVDIYDELVLRLAASDGYFHMVFTATLGQEFWRQVMEPQDFEEEPLKDAWKRCISMYDCKFYEDGTPSHWTDEKISQVVARCQNHKEVLRRVFGRFVRDDSGLKYEQFDMKRHLKHWHPVPKDWHIYCGVDVGSGGGKNHPAAICFVAVRPDYKQGRVFLGWRGDGIETTAGDVLKKFQEFKSKYSLTISGQFYDWASKDFEIISSRAGEPFQKADKSHARGEDIINTLFKNDLLAIYQTEELEKLALELISVRKEGPKNKAKDDFIDAFRYAVSSIPWDFSVLAAPEGDNSVDEATEVHLNHNQKMIQERRDFVTSDPEHEMGEEFDVGAEIEEWNSLYEGTN